MITMRRNLLLGGCALVAALATACGTGTTPTAGSTPTAPTAGPTAVPTAASVATAQSSLGMILTDGQGRTVYLFDADTGPQSTCAAACVSAWPPVSTTGAPVAGPGVQAGLLGTSRRTDGSTQLTYAGHPLYYFIKDKGPGTTAGEGITNFGGSWFVVDAAGNKIDKSASSAY
ncbi:hypothetical protein [Pseudonocardia sp. GCM10023141]|uniref:COG4315 family predicted lipoprotein n=1 Tax=Pseudonocardia sp. GCM10023141 TaxID=3252653 RepID=UPI003619B47F